jgi:O-6-methylguanine DNA methyltransferase
MIGEVRFVRIVSPVFAATAKSPVGWVGVASSSELALAVVLGLPSQMTAEEALIMSLGRFCPVENLVIKWQIEHPLLLRLLAYLEGGHEDFREISVGIPSQSEFTRRIYQRLRQVPRGQLITYRRLAELAGFPQASRAVGQCMRRNLTPVLIPCHRVIRSDGNLGGFSPAGYMKDSGEGLRLKEWLLKLENVFRGEKVRD